MREFTFGKYKGLTVDEVAARDPQYIEWLQGQSWFKGFDGIEPLTNEGRIDCSPEHNMIQARFLDQEFCMAFAFCAFPDLTVKRAAKVVSENVADVDVLYDTNGPDDLLSDDDEGSAFAIVEIKPFIGDDYPQIIRQMRNHIPKFMRLERPKPYGASGAQNFPQRLYRQSMRSILLYGRFESKAITEDQFSKIIRQTEFTNVVRLGEVEEEIQFRKAKGKSVKSK